MPPTAISGSARTGMNVAPRSASVACIPKGIIAPTPLVRAGASPPPVRTVTVNGGR
ncbi:hypothetical protein ACFPRL_35885 [Pseudoclavibacter helvolus]